MDEEKGISVERGTDRDHRGDLPAPVPFTGADLMTVHEVARYLRCSVDTVRRFPKDHLPIYRPGRENLYFREDVLRYLRGHLRVENLGADRLLMEITGDMLGSHPDGVPRRSSKGRMPCATPQK